METLAGAGQVTALSVGLFVACSWIVAGAAIAAVQVPHQGLHEHIELPPLVHWLRDTAVAVPLAAVAVGMAALVVARGTGRTRGGAGRSLAPWIAWAVLAALLFAVLSIPGNQVHGVLFGAEEEVGIGWLEDALLDAGIVLVASLATLVPASLAGSRLWPAARVDVQSQEAVRAAPARAAGLPAARVTTVSTRVGGNS